MSALTYSAGGDQECYHDEYSHFQFPKGQNLYWRDWDLVVTDLAKDFHTNHDGWESSWPIQIRIYEDRTEVARFMVEREHEPTFFAHELETGGDRSEIDARRSA